MRRGLTADQLNDPVPQAFVLTEVRVAVAKRDRLLEGGAQIGQFLVDAALQRGIRPHVAEKPFRVDGREYPTSTLLIIGENNPDDLEAQLNDVAERHDVTIRAISTAKAEVGPDLGWMRLGAFLEDRDGRTARVGRLPLDRQGSSRERVGFGHR